MANSEWLLIFIGVLVVVLLVGIGWCWGYYSGVMAQREADKPIQKPVLNPGWDEK